MFVYRNVSSGQTVESADRLPHLDGLARWVRSEQTAKPKPQPTPEPSEAEPKPAPRRRPRKATE